MLCISTIFKFFNVLLDKANCFKTGGIYYIIYFRINCIIDQIGQNTFLQIFSSFARTQVKTDCKTQITANKAQVFH